MVGVSINEFSYPKIVYAYNFKHGLELKSACFFIVSYLSVVQRHLKGAPLSSLYLNETMRVSYFSDSDVLGHLRGEMYF